MSMPRLRKPFGEWTVIGPVDQLREAMDKYEGVIEVARKDGSTELVRMRKISRPFEAKNGKMIAYGFVAGIDEL